MLPDLHLRLTTDRGVFSPDRVDLGTRVLLESVPAPPPQGRLLDLGCGYGPIALVLARRAPRVRVVGVDTNSRAVRLARENAVDNQVYNVDFYRVDEKGRVVAEPGEATVDLSGPFDALWSNPPVRIGKAALHSLLRTWLARLSPGGAAHLVVHRHLGADTLQRWLEEQGHVCERVASRSGYRVLRAVRE